MNIDIDKLNREIGHKIWECRIELGITRSQIAKIIGVSHQQFEKYEKGLNRISAGTLAAIIQHFDVTPDYFFLPSKFKKKVSDSQKRLCMELSRNFLKIEKPNHRKLLMIASRLLIEKEEMEIKKPKKQRKKRNQKLNLQ